MLELKNEGYKTKSEIKELAPSIFATKGAEITSEKYTHIPTYQVIEDMELLGWNVVDAKQVKARKNIGFQKHLVVFRNPDVMIKGEDGDDAYPQILLTNSSDGKNAFTFTAGLFRLVCENGLVIKTEEFEDMKIRHMGYDFEELRKVITNMVEKLPLTVESMNKFKTIQLEMEQIKDFAMKALEIRLGDEIKNIPSHTFDLDSLVEPIRNEDKGNDLWSVYNRIQEKIINGMFNYGSKMRKARKIKNFNQDIKLNAELYQLAETFVQ